MENLHTWLDAVAISLNIHQTFVYDINDARVRGCYHRMNVQQEAAFRALLHNKLQMWGVQAINSHLSCGYVLEVSGGSDGVFFAAVPIGPFQG